jgi:pimeloyl-ACP methyl ester carboxylesterase
MSSRDRDCADHFISAPDGLRLYARSYRSSSGRRPVVCLPGLARTTLDFDSVAAALAGGAEKRRHVIAIDYRGRGQSDYDPNPANYNLATELADLLAVLTALEVPPAVFLGTSRGGILAMLLASVRPAAIAGVILNDIGPVIETQGLLRIKSYVGRLPQPKSYDDGGEILRRLLGAQFPTLTQDQWTLFAKRTFEDKDGSLKVRYDPKLALVLKGISATQSLPPLWKEFEALALVPAMLIRGVNSDILSAETVEAMRVRRPDMTVLEVPDQGHAPLLAEREVISAICTFVEKC